MTQQEVTCTIYEISIPNDYGKNTPGIRVECDRCGSHQDAYGRSDRSVRRCFAQLAEICDEHNFYVEGERIIEV